MKQQYFGQIDLTKLGNIVRQHPELVKEVNFKDGAHKLINIAVLDKERQDNYGNTACLKVSCKREEEKKMLNRRVKFTQQELAKCQHAAWQWLQISEEKEERE